MTVSCEHYCPKGQRTWYDFSNADAPIQRCEQCGMDEIAVTQGFELSPAMMFDEEEIIFPDLDDPIQRKFDTECYSIDMESNQLQRFDRTRTDCLGWSVTSRGLLAQRPYEDDDLTETKHVTFKLTYEDTFFRSGTIMFKYRSGMKSNQGVVNGHFVFLIDGEKM
jgi:hypothetical protein